ncbi:MAG: hypothetical protein NPINA01_13120 [Nitrospinaceae bacterium]|nr:MAG: hypothetical protein NPINA01_13120 [Nitrospinaceae bacterium]
MAEKESEEIVEFYESKKQGSILGDADFIDRIKEKYLFSDPDIEVTEKRKIRGEGVVVLVKREICRTFKVDESCLFQGKRGTVNIPRLMALLLSKELSGLKLSELGYYFGLSNYRTVGTHCWRFRNKIKGDKGLQKNISSLMRIYSQEKT